MYQPGTILTLKEPRSTEEEAFAYDRVEVIGQSPIDHGIRSEEWTGAPGQGVLIKPAAAPVDPEDYDEDNPPPSPFGSTLDEPYGKLQSLYDVDFIPPNEIVASPVKVIQSNSGSAGPSPEEQFAEEAQKNPQPQSDGPHRRRRTKQSPLDAAPQEAPNRGADEEFAPTATESDERPEPPAS